jgi:hypothetical protein
MTTETITELAIVQLTVMQNDTDSRLGITMTDQEAEFGKLVWPHAHHIVQPYHVLDNLHIHTSSAPLPPYLWYQLTFLSDDPWTKYPAFQTWYQIKIFETY